MRRQTGCWVLLALVLGACSSSMDTGSAVSGGPSEGGPANGSGDGSIAIGPASGGSVGASVPPEQEVDQSFRAPVVSGRWVWTANPNTGNIAIVDAKNFGVRLAQAGQGPTYLTALPTAPNTSKALVINVDSQDATLLSAGDTGAVSASAPIPLQAAANSWAVSKSGHFAIAWTDTSSVTADPAEFYQDISVLDLSGKVPQATRLVVGPLPTRVFIEDDEKKAFVVASSGISIIDLTGAAPRIVREEAVSDDVREAASTRDVSVLPDGSYALVRHEGSAIVTLVRLSDGTRSQVTLTGPVTDLDLAPDGTSAFAVVRGQLATATAGQPGVLTQGVAGAPGDGGAGGANSDGGAGGANPGEGGAKSDGGEGGVRSGAGGAGPGAAGAGADAGAGSGDAGASSGSDGGAPSTPGAAIPSTLAILPLPGIFTAPTKFTSVSLPQVFGLVEIAPQGSLALLYSNAVVSDYLTVLDTASSGSTFGKNRSIDVHGVVHDVFPSPDGAYAIVSLSPQTIGDKSGFAVVPVANQLPSRTQTTEAPVVAVAQSSSPLGRAIITVSDGATNFAAYVVHMPELIVDRVTLPSLPLPGATGLVPDAGVAYVAQSSPNGRITFIDLETGVPRTLTGFEISAQVIDGN